MPLAFYELRCHVSDPEAYRQAPSEIRMAVLDRFRLEGIEIPFPQRVITMLPEEATDQDQ